MPLSSLEPALHQAATLLSRSDGLLITAGAGIGIDSGLPDFRGDRGFWKAYPALGQLGMSFVEIANPRAFKAMPGIAWGFYGHRLKLYRDTVPHAGFARLLDLAARLPHGAFVFTSNVDGQFEKAGFAPEKVAACHGSIHRLQCMEGCGQPVWSADEFEPLVDTPHCRLVSPLPTCPGCGGLARPNILMFGDWDWDATIAEQEQARLQAWLARVERPVVIEIGAGTAIPTVRRFGEGLDCPLIRINTTEPEVQRAQAIALAVGARTGIEGLCCALAGLDQPAKH